MTLPEKIADKTTENMNKKVIEIARMRDGGSLLLECDGIQYFYDHGIGSETWGELFYPNTFNNVHTPRFARVPEPEKTLVINAIKDQIAGYNIERRS